jgi:hypothetical protein
MSIEQELHDRFDALRTATCQRDFFRKPQAVIDVHQSEVSLLREALRNAAEAGNKALSPAQRFDVSKDLSVALVDAGKPLATCYINAQGKAGVLMLQFFDANASEIENETISLDRYSEDRFVWHTKNGTVESTDLANYIFRRVLDTAIVTLHAVVAALHSPSRRR